LPDCNSSNKISLIVREENFKVWGDIRVKNKYQPLAQGEVLSVKEAVQFLIGHGTFRSDEFIEAFKKQLLEYNIGGLTQEKEGWFTDKGIECEALRFGSSGWQKGFVRINLEFCPAEEGTANPTQTTQQPQPQSVPPTLPQEETEFGADLFGESTGELDFAEEEDFDLGEDFTAEPTAEAEEDLDFDLGDDELDLGEDFTAEPTAEAEEDLDFDLGDDELDLGEDFTAEPTAEAEEDLDFDLGDDELDLGEDFTAESGESVESAEEDLDIELGEELTDPFASIPETPETNEEEGFDPEAFGEENGNKDEPEDTLDFGVEDFSGDNEEDLLGEELDVDLGLSEDDEDDDLMDLEELEADEDFSFEDFGLAKDESENKDIWQNQTS
jgi:pilus assembly protein FimV